MRPELEDISMGQLASPSFPNDLRITSQGVVDFPDVHSARLIQRTVIIEQ